MSESGAARARTISRPRRGLNLAEAAFYVGVSPDKFTCLMDDGRMPKPKLIDDIRVWDVEELDIFFRGLPQDDRGPGQRTPAARRLQRDNRPPPYRLPPLRSS